MSKYTTEIRFICESNAGLLESVGQKRVNEIIDLAIPKIFDFEFPIFDEDYRNLLCHKILKHYYTREIAYETVGLWKLKLDTKLNEIMPYYNQLYKTELIQFNPLSNIDLTRERTTQAENEQTQDYNKDTDSSGTANVTDDRSLRSNSTTTVDNQNIEKFNDTPQNEITPTINGEYLTTLTVDDITGDTESEVESSDTQDRSETTTFKNKDIFNGNQMISSTEDYLEKVSGVDGRFSSASLLMEFRKTILNIDMSIINDLESLFFQLW